MQTVAVDRRFWNIVKGIGILTVVIGHLNSPLTNYIYLFHMPLFFFVNGFLYNEEKYGDDPYLNIAAKIKSSWIKYIVVYWIYILLHNLFFQYDVLEVGASFYSTKELFVKLSLAVAGSGSELLAGPLWFVPVSVISSCLLGFIVTFSRKFQKRFNSGLIKYSIQFILILVFTVVGYCFMVKKCDLFAHMQISLLVMPFLWVGYLLRNCKVDLNKCLNPIVAIICAILVYITHLYYQLELVLFMQVYPYMHIVALLGIYMCLYIAKLFSKIPFIKSIFDWGGQASFFIMSVHFAIFRLFDRIMAQIWYPDDPITKYRELPNSFPEINYVYVLIGFVIPLIIFVVYKKIKGFFVSLQREKF